MSESEGPGRPGTLAEVVQLFLKLGVLGFGGPAAHIAMMRDEVVRRRRWVDDARFLDLLGATNLIPGPNSTEMAIHIGYVRAGWPGLLRRRRLLHRAGGAHRAGAGLGVRALRRHAGRGGAPVRRQAGDHRGRRAGDVGAAAARRSKAPLLAAVGVAALALALAGVNELVAAVRRRGARDAALRGAARRARGAPAAAALRRWRCRAAAPAQRPSPPRRRRVGSGTLFLTFLKIGAVLYGSGYVLLAFLRGDFVERLRLADRAAAAGRRGRRAGHAGPGVHHGHVHRLRAGAAARAPCWPPSASSCRRSSSSRSSPLLPRIRGSPWAGAFLDGVNVGRARPDGGGDAAARPRALVDVLTVVLALAAAGLLILRGVNSAWLILGGAAAGVAVSALLRAG